MSNKTVWMNSNASKQTASSATALKIFSDDVVFIAWMKLCHNTCMLGRIQ